MEQVLPHPPHLYIHSTHPLILLQVDRSVTGLIAQQQCCGPLQLPVSDVAVMAQTHFGYTGAATAIGEQPLKVSLCYTVACMRLLPNQAWRVFALPGKACGSLSHS